MKIVWQYLKKYKILLLLNIISAILIACCEIGIPFVIGQYIIDAKEISLDTDFVSKILKIVLIFFILVFFGILGNILINFCCSSVSAFLFNDLSTDIFKKVQTLSSYELEKIGISSIINRNTSDVYQIMSFISTFYRSAIVAPIILLISFIMICFIEISLVFGIVMIIPFLFFMIIFMVKKTYYLSISQKKELDQLNLITRENLTGFKVIRSLGQSEYEQKRFAKSNINYTSFSIKLFKFLVSIDPIFYFLLNMSIIVTIGLGAFYLQQKDNSSFTLGTLFKCIEFQFHVLSSILNFLLLFMMFPKTLVSANRIQEIIEYQTIIKNNVEGLKNNQKIHKIEFKNVNFYYPNTNKNVLNNINFVAYKNETIAIVGATGSGKSTLMNFLLRLYNVTDGKIKLNDIDIENYDINYLRSKIGFVSQKSVLFKGTILSNLLMGNNNASINRIVDAAKISQSYDFIEAQTDKFNESVSEFGNNFSGGQKQRLSIARNFVKNPDVYVFDDSFSALDYTTDYELKKAFASIKKDVIVFVIAQRLSSIIQSDKIIVLDQGIIVDIGKHHELIKRCQIYKEIAISQHLLEI